ncbi:hypothetical protein GYMLUDRAFT_255885 [Collybiopsis luxurians FD-317 M1]|nr:hypothetical protein GYMLUDRAFT_255885 [Collybiopsis luxurians FD-317 M1]
MCSHKIIPDQEVLGRITDLSSKSNAHNLRNILNLRTNLQTLYIMDEEPLEDDVSSAHSPTSLSKLPSLYVTNSFAFHGGLRSFNTPALDTLKLYYSSLGSHSGHGTSSHVEQFLGRSGCSLTKLEIESYWTEKDIIVLLRSLPALRELTILALEHRYRSCSISTAFIESLHHYHRSSLPIVPKLNSLSLEVESPGFNHKLFVEMILTRWISDLDYAGVSCIRSIDLHLWEYVDKRNTFPWSV